MKDIFLYIARVSVFVVYIWVASFIGDKYIVEGVWYAFPVFGSLALAGVPFMLVAIESLFELGSRITDWRS